MIDRVSVRDVATFDRSGVDVDLKKINYIFGSNGTGKTTISEFLRNQEEYPSCSVKWKDRAEYDILVYNRNFIHENFSVRNNLKGIFTLGKESTDLLEKIEEKKVKIEHHEEKLKSLEENIDGINEELDTIKDEFMIKCWKLKTKYDDSFKEAFTGARGSRESFMKKCLDEAKNNTSDLFSYDELIKRFESIFKGSQKKIDVIRPIKYNILYEESSIFNTKIIGKKDVDIAKLIDRLDISDWVQQGYQQLSNTDDICPFCQQKLPLELEKQLEEYFDETYRNQIDLLNSSSEKYITEIQNIFNEHDYLAKVDIPFVNTERVRKLFEILSSIFKENKQKLKHKKSEPSSSIKLSPMCRYVEEINKEIEQANAQITDHNQIMDNIIVEKDKLKKDIWRFIVEENKSEYINYEEKSTKKVKTLKGMNKRKQELKGYQTELNIKVIKLQNQLTSVLPSINEINKLLKSFGFTNFQLIESEDEGNYKIVRGDGNDANETLSEGEKTFITFLYFYRLINGGNEQDKVNTNRVIVIDDPISSLDSNVLFIVSHLINNLKKEIRSANSIFKQLIILTHNVYFHKEVSFNKGMSREKQHDETFWILTKTNNVSNVKAYEENPIKNSYELLWRELKENPYSIATPNIMRRILENYFKFFGDIDITNIIEDFPEEDKVACNSLMSWVHDGSHHVNDDLYVDSNKEQNMNYFRIFKEIFIILNQESHFNMMMSDFEYINEEDTDFEQTEEELKESFEQVAATNEKLDN